MLLPLSFYGYMCSHFQIPSFKVPTQRSLLDLEPYVKYSTSVYTLCLSEI
jgi:hypothetical protein